MLDLSYIRNFYPQPIADNAAMAKHLVKEYVELMVLDHLASSPYIGRFCFIGGTCLRLVKGIDRFSEDLDFDCKDMSREDFLAMTDDVVTFLQRNGLSVEVKDKDDSHLTAFRRNIYFPGLLFDLQLTGHRDERFLLKVEMQDQGVAYPTQMTTVNRCGFFFHIPVPSDGVLLSMKLSALLARAKGRDFYDAIFLWQQTSPDFDFLAVRCGISNEEELKNALLQKIATIDLGVKMRDFEHLMFQSQAAQRILNFSDLLR